PAARKQVQAVSVTDGTLPILRVHPPLSRLFNRKDDLPGSPETVLLSNAYWQKKFGGSVSAIGRRLVVDGKARNIIGVLPPGFHFDDAKAALFLPFQFDRTKETIWQFQLLVLGPAQARQHSCPS